MHLVMNLGDRFNPSCSLAMRDLIQPWLYCPSLCLCPPSEPPGPPSGGDLSPPVSVAVVHGGPHVPVVHPSL